MKQKIQEIFRNNKKIILILLYASFFIFSFISSTGFYGDDAIYATRSIGKLDYMFADEQSTPLQWFDELPFWAHLSYHDILPLLPAIQHIFLSVHESIFFAKLPFALMGLSSIFLLYLYVKKAHNETLAIHAAFFLSVNTLFLWASRHSFLEIGVTFFMLLSLVLLLYYTENPKKFWLPFALSLGLVFLTKYTAVFIFPAILIYLYVSDKSFLRKRETYFVLGIFLCFVAPVVVYNIGMYNAVGHFDLQISRFLGQDTPWRLSGVGAGYVRGLFSVFTALAHSSYVYILLACSGVVWVAYRRLHTFMLPLLILFFSTLLFAFQSSARFLPPMVPFLAIFCGFVTHRFHLKFGLYMVSKILIYVLGVYFTLFALNTHWLQKPLVEVIGVTVGGAGSRDLGVYAMDKYLDSLVQEIHGRHDVYGDLKNKDKYLRKYVGENSISNAVIVYDEFITWFSVIWLFERRRFYYNIPILSATEFTKYKDSILPRVSKVIYIKVEGSGPIDQERKGTEDISGLQKVDSIYTRMNGVAFSIFEWSVN